MTGRTLEALLATDWTGEILRSGYVAARRSPRTPQTVAPGGPYSVDRPYFRHGVCYPHEAFYRCRQCGYYHQHDAPETPVCPFHGGAMEPV